VALPFQDVQNVLDLFVAVICPSEAPLGGLRRDVDADFLQRPV